MNYARCGDCNTSRTPDRRSYSPLERGAPFTTSGFAGGERTGAKAELSFKAHPHMLRHACASRWPTRAATPARCKALSAARTCSTPCVLHRTIAGSLQGVTKQYENLFPWEFVNFLSKPPIKTR